LYQYSALQVKGYGIVAGLAGTGSSECPPELRRALAKYIQARAGKGAVVNPNEFINSMNTAVVEIYGTIPAIAMGGDRFDIKVVALAQTQTTSLAGGTLYTAELKEMSRLFRFDQYSATLGYAQGPIYIDKLSDGTTPTNGYVLGGGLVSQSVRLAMGLYKANYLMSSAIRNRVNERFGQGTAKAISPNELEFAIPEKYSRQRAKFLMMLKLLYLSEDSTLRQKRIDMLVKSLAEDEDKVTSEHSLEAIGRMAVNTISPLLLSENETVRFHAARCTLAIGDNRSLGVLQDIARDEKSKLRIAAIEAIGLNAKRDIAEPILERMLSDSDFSVKLAAFNQLSRLGGIAISRTNVGGKFFIDQVSRKGPTIIYVSREEVPRIVVFGGPVSCEKGIYVESADRSIMINAAADGKGLSVMRKLPNRPRLVGPLTCGFELTDLVRCLCEDPDIKDNPLVRTGLGASYMDVLPVLSKMCEIGAIRAEFIAGGVTEAGAFMERAEAKER
jgi:hypothetical protein